MFARTAVCLLCLFVVPYLFRCSCLASLYIHVFGFGFKYSFAGWVAPSMAGVPGSAWPTNSPFEGSPLLLPGSSFLIAYRNLSPELRQRALLRQLQSRVYEGLNQGVSPASALQNVVWILAFYSEADRAVALCNNEYVMLSTVAL